MTFHRFDGQILQLHISEDNVVRIYYKDLENKEFKHTGNDRTFVIPYLVQNSHGNFAASQVIKPRVWNSNQEKKYDGSWATYVKEDNNNRLGILSIPSLKLKVNLQKFDGKITKESELNVTFISDNGACKD